jgi:hypothetical protein
MKKGLLWVLTFVVVCLVGWGLLAALSTRAARPAHVAEASAGRPVAQDSAKGAPSELITQVDLTEAVPHVMGLSGGFLDIPVRADHKLTVYCETYIDGEFQPELSYKSVGDSTTGIERVGVTFLNPNDFLPPDLQTRKRKLTFHALGVGTPQWIDMPDWGLGSWWGCRFQCKARLFADRKPTLLATIEIYQTRFEAPPGESERKEWLIEILAEQQPKTSAELDQEPFPHVDTLLDAPVDR